MTESMEYKAATNSAVLQHLVLKLLNLLGNLVFQIAQFFLIL